MILHLIVTLTLNVREFQDELPTGNRNFNKSTSVLVNHFFFEFLMYDISKNYTLIIFYVIFIFKLCKKY